MGCMFRLGCLALIVIAAIVGWITKDRWWPGDREDRAAGPKWEHLTPAGAQRTRTALTRLSESNGPVFATVSGGDVASYVLLDVVGGIPGFADSAQAAVIDDQLVVRGPVPLRQIGALRDLGPLAGMLNDTEPVQLAGRLRVVEPGRGELTITDLRVRDIRLPNGLLDRVLGRPDGDTTTRPRNSTVPVPLPPHIADIRVADGRVTLYKNLP